MAEAPTTWLQNLGIAIEIVCPSLALLITILRLYVRIDSKSLGWAMKELHIGMHYWDVPTPMDPTKGMIWIYIVGAVYNPILALVKQSVLIFLLRFSGVKNVVRNIVWGTAIFNFALMIATFFTVIFQCTPIEMNWKPMMPGNCIEQFTFGVSTACLTILTDLIAVALPFYIFLGLKMNRKRKIGLMVVFMLGIIVTVVSVVRLYFLAQNFTDKSPDKNFSLGFCVSAIECNLAIITASAPALWPLFRRWMPQLKTAKDQNYYNHKYHANQQGWIRTGDGPNTTSTAPEESIGMKDMGGLTATTHVRSNGSNSSDSDEELMTGTGIMRTTHFAVTRDDSPIVHSSGH
ncbi:hypothetical protein CCHL11_00418 [Colletotrichum chlorophyti]|uniref:Rhodopsin domain-containing protein n=1 Tax=Colletotrichum chlorophyti TaxID=708187 RepID=A0A1Q8RTX1_9PEZI|nr:hypothetical protein CCHL11_00418 [Colletotrichum chlorophyti]